VTENSTAMLLPWMGLWAFAARGPLKAEHKREKKISAPKSLEKGPDENTLQAEEALDRYGNSILRLAYSYLHNKADAEEVLQDTLIRLMEAAPSFESEEHRKAWLLRVAGNLSKNRISYNKVRRTDELSETLTAEEREDLSFVWEAVKALPEPCREAIHLFYCEGYPTAQIARILGRKEATVRSDLRRGRARLRETLKEAYDFE
jgi:RNA polymerase sigma factor (sigma-70 family)